jgi:hypothetical protein
MPSDQTRLYKIRYEVDDRASGPIDALTQRLQGAAARCELLTKRARETSDGIAWLGNAAASSADLVRDFSTALGSIPKSAEETLRRASQAFGRLDFNAQTATQSVDRLNKELAETGATAKGIGSAQLAMQQLQRTSYGARMNAQELGEKLDLIGSKAAGLRQAAVSTQGLGQSLKSGATGGTSLDLALGSVVGRMVGFQALNGAIDSVGESIRSAREATEAWAESSLKLRDQLREIANLRGKSGPDDSVLASNLKLRQATGMTQPDATKFQEQFLGSLPLAVDAGGIDKQTAEKLSAQVGRLAVRTGLDGSTAGDLAGVMGMFGKVPDERVGLGRAQQVVDLLNDGRGNLTPLTRALIKGAASTVGQGKPFASLQERAAAISVASGIGDKGATDTTVGAAIRGLSPGGTVEHRLTLERLGIGGNQSFQERIDRLAPLFEEARKRGQNPNDALTEAGFGNVQDRRALIGFFENREVLRKRIDSVAESADAPDAKARVAADRSDRLNSEFYGADKAARDRVATARLDSAKVARGNRYEDLTIARKEAEANLQKRGEIDRFDTNLTDAFRGGFGLFERFGADSGRQQRIDDEVRRMAKDLARSDPDPKIRDRPFDWLAALDSARYLAVRRARDERAGAKPAAVAPPQLPPVKPLAGDVGAAEDLDGEPGVTPPRSPATSSAPARKPGANRIGSPSASPAVSPPRRRPQASTAPARAPARRRPSPATPAEPGDPGDPAEGSAVKAPRVDLPGNEPATVKTPRFRFPGESGPIDVQPPPVPNSAGDAGQGDRGGATPFDGDGDDTEVVDLLTSINQGIAEANRRRGGLFGPDLRGGGPDVYAIR